MAVYTEKIKDVKTGQMVTKKVNGKIQYYIRTYVTLGNGQKKQITRHNKDWIGREGMFLAQQEENILKNKIVCQENKNMKLCDLAQKYFNDIETKLKISTIGKYKDNYKLFILPKLGNINIYKLSPKDNLDFQTYINTLYKKTNNNHKLSVKYKQSIHITLSAILNFGCKYYNLEKNVASVVGNFKKPKGTPKKNIDFLTLNEFNQFIKYEDSPIYKDFFTILFYTGMRRGELLALTIDDIDFKNNEININKAINPKFYSESVAPKTDTSVRKIKVSNIVIDILKKYKYKNNSIFGIEIIKLATLQRHCFNNCKRAQIKKNIRIHDFRHSFTSLCINQGIPIEIISKYLGHSNISTTLNIYAHLYPNSQERLIDVINNL